MTRRKQEWLVNDYRVVTFEPVKPKEEGWGWAVVFLVVVVIIGAIALFGGH
jgi:hypothetical protein